MKLLGRLFFPKAPPHEQRRNVRELTVAIILGLLLSALICVFIFYLNSRRGH
jgi:hypothetical protein